METITTDGGGEQPVPQESAAVAETSTDQVITTDENGTPTLEPTSQSASAETEPQGEETLATDDTVEWAKNKGLEINPDNPNEVKLAKMQHDTEKKMHEATQKAYVPPPELLAPTGDTNYDPLVERQNTLELRQYVRDWFDANPGMKDHRTELQKIAVERPWLADMDDVKAHFLANPSREAQIKMDGGREALTNLAQKQSQIPPGANATNSSEYASGQINPKNVYELIDKNDQSWFQANYKEINKAISGK